MSAEGIQPAVPPPGEASIRPNARSTSSLNDCNSASSGSPFNRIIGNLPSGFVPSPIPVSMRGGISTPRDRRRSKFRQCPVLDLADTLSRDAEPPADLVQRQRLIRLLAEPPRKP